MGLPSIILLAILACMMALFVYGRPRYDLVAISALGASWVAGIVPAKEMFSGFGDDIVIIIGSALIISQAVYQSGIVERALHHFEHRVASTASQVALLAGTTMILSTVIKNIGALSMLIPAASTLSRRHNTPVSRLFMPMSFASLLGGIVTLVGTSPNVIVSRLREDIVGQPFGFLDFAYVGLPIALAGWLYLVLAFRLLPAYRPKSISGTEILDEIGYTTEVIVPAESPAVGKPVGELLASDRNEVAIVRLLRGDNKRISSPSTQLVKPDDKLILHGSSRALQLVISKGGLEIARANRLKATAEKDAELVTAEAIVTPNAVMLDWSPSQLRVSDRFNINIVAINRGRQAITQRLKQVRFQPGDVVLLQGYQADIANAIQQLGLLPLAGRNLAIGKRKRQFYPALIMLAAIAAMVSGIAPVPVAFLFAAIAMVLFKCISLHEAYASLDPALLVTFAALVPLSHAIETTGTAAVIATWLAYVSQSLPVSGAIASIILLAMIVTPFLNNAATVLVLAPVAAETARQLGIPADAALMAVAIGAASDFLTPIGHQCNMLAMGPGGYRFTDYPRLGLPLSILVVAMATPLIRFFWT